MLGRMFHLALILRLVSVVFIVNMCHGFLLPNVVGAQSPGTEKTFFYEPINWRFTIPSGWEIRNDTEIQAVRERGKKLIEDSQKVVLPKEEFNAPKQLLYLQHPRANKFSSDIEPYVERDGQTYAQVQQSSFDMLLQAFKDKGINVQSTRGEEVIDGIHFATLSMDLYSNDGKVLLGKSLSFDARIGKFTFLMGCTCNDERQFVAITKAMRNSKFR